MITRALAKYVKISPKKLAPLARLLSRKRVEEARFLLVSINKKGAPILKGVLESALNNAKRLPNKHFAEEDLFISKISVNPGPMLKRFRAMSMGRAGRVRKRTCHILVELDALSKPVPAAQKTPSAARGRKTAKMGKNNGA